MNKPTILITGGSGFLGRELAVKLRDSGEVVLAARNNARNMRAQSVTGCKTVPLDVSRIESVRDVFLEFKPSVVIHAAATKFVDLSERYPFECIDVNVLGSENVARVAIDLGVDVVVGVSTDKAAPPAGNIYGLSKAVMERLFSSLNGKTATKFGCVRFGNIAWSTGSVLPIWKRMIDQGGVIESTGPDMRRFFFSVSEAADVVHRAWRHMDLIQGKILSLRMKAAQIRDFLNVWTKSRSGAWKQIAARPGDKMDEYLIGESECAYASEVSLDGLPHFLIDFSKPADPPLGRAVSSANAERLSEVEILRIIDEMPPEETQW